MTYPPPPSNDPYGNQGQPQYGQGQPQYGQPAYGAGPAVAYATWIQRVGAYVIDNIAVWVLVALGNTLGHGKNGTNILALIFSVLALAVTIYNRWIQAGKTGQSWGKKVLGLRLVGEQTGQPIGAGMAFLRDVCHLVDGIICYIGFLFPLWDAKKQTIADKIVKTIVVTA